MGAAAGVGMGANFVAGQLQGWASLLEKWAMQDAFNAEQARQAAYQKQASGVFNAQVASSGSDQAKKDMATAFDSRTADYKKQGAVPLGQQLPSQSQDPRNAILADMTGASRANLEKYGDWQFKQKQDYLTTGNKLDQISNFAQGTAGVFPYRMYDAQHSQDALSEAAASFQSLSSGAAGYKSAFSNSVPQQAGYGQMNSSQPPQGYAYPEQYGGPQTQQYDQIDPATGNYFYSEG